MSMVKHNSETKERAVPVNIRNNSVKEDSETKFAKNGDSDLLKKI